MKGFTGFSDGLMRMTPIPEDFFARLLPEIDHLGELKLTLFAFRNLAHSQGDFRFLTRSVLLADPDALRLCATPGIPPQKTLQDALERAIARGTFLSVRVEAETQETYYFLNSPRGRAAAKGLEEGKWSPADLSIEAKPIREKQNLFTLYEQNIGPLTPIIADLLRDAEQEYSSEWVERAIQIAAERNARNWRYISAVLERFKQEGMRNLTDPSRENRRRYVEGEYADFIKH